MREKIIAGNWKMHGCRAANAQLVNGVLAGAASARCKLVLCVPYPYLSDVYGLVAGSAVSLGAQNVSEHASGAFTGEVGGAMLAELGCAYVIVGHSERRSLYGERDADVAAKVVRALADGLTPIVCVGETLAEREQGVTREVVVRQLSAVIDAIGTAALDRLVVAYEPVWAIGTGRTATPAQAQEVHAWIRERLAQADPVAATQVAILYGGSMKPANAGELLSQPDIDGGLIGGASLVADDFLAIANAVN